MTTLKYTDPREVAAYWDRFEERSISAIQPYLWVFDEGADLENDDAASVTPIRREELDWMVIDEKREYILLDAAVWVQQNPGHGGLLVLSHVQNEEHGSSYYPDLRVLLTNKIEAENLAKQILGEAAIAFPVVE